MDLSLRSRFQNETLWRFQKMAITEPPIPEIEQPKPHAETLGPRNSRWAGFQHLLWARLLEMKREPEIIFWVFVFPLLLALGLGIAFRGQPATAISVAVIESPETAKTVALLQASSAHASIHTTVLDRQAALKGFQFGRFDLVLEPNADGSITYHYDP